MGLYHAFETLLVPLIVVACALSVAARYMPRTRERFKAALAARLGGTAATGWRRSFVVRLAPQAAAGCASGCDSGGCNTCGSNEGETTSANATDAAGNKTPVEQPIRFVRKH